MSFLYDRNGQRKYLTVSERRLWLQAANGMPIRQRLFLKTLAYSGTRISEVLALLPASFDEAEGVMIIESLKKRRRGVSRAVPLPRGLQAAPIWLGHSRLSTTEIYAGAIGREERVIAARIWKGF